MFQLNYLVPILAAATLSAALAGCSDSRMNGGYTGDTSAMTRLNAHQPFPQQPITTQTATSNYVYRGGRDPVTGKANLTY